MELLISDSNGSQGLLDNSVGGSEGSEGRSCIQSIDRHVHLADESDSMMLEDLGFCSSSMAALRLHIKRPRLNVWPLVLSGSGIFDLSASTPMDDDSEPQEEGRVSFSPVLVTAYIPHPIHHDEIPEQWYNTREYHHIREDCDRTVEMIKSGQAITEDQYCKRGLEARFRDRVSFLTSKEEIVNEILDKQMDLWSEGQSNHARLLAKIYCMHSTQYAFRAVVTGRHDWKAIHDGTDEIVYS
jgi:hypothetical protein